MMKTPLERFMANIEMVPECGCWIWMGALFKSGYGAFSFEGKAQRAHRVSWKLFKGPIPDELNVLHHCDIEPCVNPNHIFLGVQQDNISDMVKKGRGPKRKLTPDQAAEIRGSKENRTILAKRYGVTHTAITQIQTGKAWPISLNKKGLHPRRTSLHGDRDQNGTENQ